MTRAEGQLIRIALAARLSGQSQRVVREWCRAGLVPGARRIRKRWFFQRERLIKWLGDGVFDEITERD